MSLKSDVVEMYCETVESSDWYEKAKLEEVGTLWSYAFCSLFSGKGIKLTRKFEVCRCIFSFKRRAKVIGW